MTVSIRLKQIMEDNNLNIKQFSKTCGISYSTLHNYLIERRVIGADSLVKISDGMNVNLNWLLTGKGLMYLEEEKGTNQSPGWFTNWWKKSDEVHKHWLEIQLTQTPPVTK